MIIMNKKCINNLTKIFFYTFILYIFHFLCTACQSDKTVGSNTIEKNIIDTLYFKGRIAHSIHVNANSGVLVIQLDTSNVQDYKGIYDDQDDLGFGLITNDTAFIMTEGFDRITPNHDIVYKHGWWLFNGGSDSLAYWRVNNIVGTIHKSKRYISNYRGDGLFKNHYFLGQLIFMVWAPIIAFILFAIGFKILRVKV